MNIYYSNEPLFQHHIDYEQCSTIFDHSKNVPIPQSRFDEISQNDYHNVPQTLQLSDSNYQKSEQQSQHEITQKNEKKLTRKTKVDTSAFSIEERLLAAVWVHERKRTKSSIGEIRREFQQRFGRDPPAKNTLLVWERKLFSTGSVYDAPRPGRPVNRRSRMAEVAASMKSSPELSLRARARALHLPCSTLRTILHKDLPQAQTFTKKDVPNKNDVKCI